MRTQFIVLSSTFSAALAAPVTTSYYGDWSNWPSWQPTWLSTIAPTIKSSSTSPSSAVSPTGCTNCTESTLVALFASKWQPYVDLVLSNVETQLDSLTSTQTHIDAIMSTLKQQFSGDMITSIQAALYNPTFIPPSTAKVSKRHGNSTGTPLSSAYEGYSYQGCMTNFASKALVQMEDTNFANLTNQKCIDYCKANGYTIAGTQSGSQCFCGNNITSSTLLIEERACATSCTGDDTQVCGDNQKLSLYAMYNVSSSVFDRSTVRANWKEVGCVADGLNSTHALTGAAYACLGMTVEMCMNFCDVMGFPVAGLEYGGECYCGNKFENVGTAGAQCSGQCNVPCIGDGSQMCGGDWTMNVYERKDIKTPVDTTCTTTTTVGCALGNCTQYDFTKAWSTTGINWSDPSVIIPSGKTEVCSTPCEVVKYYPYFIWQMHENLRTKIADRLSVDWPLKIGAVVGDTCSCEISDITRKIGGCGVEFGLNGSAETWLCDLVAAVNKI